MLDSEKVGDEEVDYVEEGFNIENLENVFVGDLGNYDDDEGEDSSKKTKGGSSKTSSNSLLGKKTRKPRLELEYEYENVESKKQKQSK